MDRQREGTFRKLWTKLWKAPMKIKTGCADGQILVMLRGRLLIMKGLGDQHVDR